MLSNLSWNRLWARKNAAENSHLLNAVTMTVAFAATLDETKPAETAILLYTRMSDGRLGYGFKSSTDEADPKSGGFRAHKDCSHKLAALSDLVTARFGGTNHVMAMTPNQVDDSLINLGRVTPSYNIMLYTYAHFRRLATCASDDSGGTWLYFLEGPNSGPTYLIEYDIATESRQPFLLERVDAHTSLAAWCDPNTQHRFVLYQEADCTGFFEFSIFERTNNVILTSVNARSATSIAATFFEDKTYAYYADTSDNLCRVVKDNGVWGSSEIFPNIAKVGASQVTVVTANRTNHVFYLPKDSEDDVMHFRDHVQ